MKKPIDFLILLAPALLWLLSSLLLGAEFALPNRLMLAVLCTAAGAGALVTNRKLPGFLALVAGVGMLAAVPVEHDMPDYLLMNAQNAEASAGYSLNGYSEQTLQSTAQDIGDVGVALMDSGLTTASMNAALIVSASEVVGRLHTDILTRKANSQKLPSSTAPLEKSKRDVPPTTNEQNHDEHTESNS